MGLSVALQTWIACGIANLVRHRKKMSFHVQLKMLNYLSLPFSGTVAVLLTAFLRLSSPLSPAQPLSSRETFSIRECMEKVSMWVRRRDNFSQPLSLTLAYLADIDECQNRNLLLHGTLKIGPSLPLACP